MHIIYMYYVRTCTLVFAHYMYMYIHYVNYTVLHVHDTVGLQYEFLIHVDEYIMTCAYICIVFASFCSQLFGTAGSVLARCRVQPISLTN